MLVHPIHLCLLGLSFSFMNRNSNRTPVRINVGCRAQWWACGRPTAILSDLPTCWGKKAAKEGVPEHHADFPDQPPLLKSQLLSSPPTVDRWEACSFVFACWKIQPLLSYDPHIFAYGTQLSLDWNTPHPATSCSHIALTTCQIVSLERSVHSLNSRWAKPKWPPSFQNLHHRLPPPLATGDLLLILLLWQQSKEKFYNTTLKSTHLTVPITISGLHSCYHNELSLCLPPRPTSLLLILTQPNLPFVSLKAPFKWAILINLQTY